MLSSLKWKSLELRRSDTRLYMLYKQSNGLATYECTSFSKNIRAEWTPGSRLSVTWPQLLQLVEYQQLRHLFINKCWLAYMFLYIPDQLEFKWLSDGF